MSLETRVDLKENLCMEKQPEPCGIVIFGGSGDLATKKLLPALWNLYRRKLLPESFFVLGSLTYRNSPHDDDEYRKLVLEVLKPHAQDSPAGELENFASCCYYEPGDYTDETFYRNLSERIDKLDILAGTNGNKIIYLAVPPSLFCPIASMLRKSGISAEGKNGHPWARVIVEKPFGHDLASATMLNNDLKKSLSEHQIYRIDHYLGKDTVQNILMLRFANTIFEPIWNRDYVDHVQITVAEEIGIGERAGYYEEAGALRDMFQNHMIQILALVAMEAPVTFDAHQYRDEKVKLMRTIRAFERKKISNWVVRGQYTAGEIGGRKVPGYLEEPGVHPGSMVETYVAMRLFIDNWRWKGVPFYLRSGKRMPRKISEVTIEFKRVPHSIFSPVLPEDLEPNLLVLRIQPAEGVDLTLNAKMPGPKGCIGTLRLHFCYCEVFGVTAPEPYERLLLDCMLGDQTLFIREDGVLSSWDLFTPILEEWENSPSSTPLYPYPAGSWGPAEAENLLRADGRRWREPEA